MWTSLASWSMAEPRMESKRSRMGVSFFMIFVKIMITNIGIKSKR